MTAGGEHPLREALTIYRVSEAIALSHEIDHILDVVLRAAIDEVKADVATLHLRDPRSGHYEERVKIVVSDGDAHASVPSPAFGVMTDQFTAGIPIRAHGGKASRFFTESIAPADRAFAAVPLQVRYMQLRAERFSRSQNGSSTRVTGRCSRVRVRIRERDRQRAAAEDLRSTNDSLVRTNTSLEDAPADVAGFAQVEEMTGTRVTRARRGVPRSSRAG
jgi:hypothetical protein